MLWVLFILLRMVNAWKIQNHQIISSYDQSVHTIKGINWYGMEINGRVVEGLWARDIIDYVTQMKQEGFNTLRIPFALEGILSGSYATPIDTGMISACISCPTNATSWDILDILFQQDMNIILDLHRLNFSQTSPYWYNNFFSEDEVITGWYQMAERYSNYRNFMGIDIYNEPHGSATVQEWSFFCLRFSNTLAPFLIDKLIFVSGIHWGEDLRGVTPALFSPDRFVLSPHSYGPTLNHLIYDQEITYRKRWETYYGYLNTSFTIMIGEWGGNQEYPPDVQWMTYFVNYLVDKQFGSCFWAWNPNSQDVRGYLLSDWKTVNPLKRSLIQQLPI